MTAPTARTTRVPCTDPQPLWRRRPGLMFLLAAYVVVALWALCLVHDARTFTLGAVVVGLALLRTVMSVRSARRGPV